MSEKIVCWHCGEALREVPKPFPRLAKCRHCEADLHVCLMCRHYNPRYSTRCDHEMAEAARELDLANFCHYLKLRPDAYLAQAHDQGKQAEAKLKALFGDVNDDLTGEQSIPAEDPMEKLRALLQGGETDKHKE